MAEPADPWIHHLAHRALQRSSDDLHLALEAMGEADHRRARALVRWFRGFGAVVDDLLTIEDRVVFPFLAARVPTYHLHADQVRSDHDELRRLVRVTAAALDRLAGDDPWRSTRPDAARAADTLRALLIDHLDLEDQDVLPLFERHVTADEYGALLRPALATIPWRHRPFALAWQAHDLDPTELSRAHSAAGPMVAALWRLGRGRYRRLAAAALGGR